MAKTIDPQTLAVIKTAQRNEIAEHFIYSGLARNTRDIHNRQILETIAKDELRHYEYWKSITQVEIKPDRLMVFWYILVSRIFGLSFGLKLMEKGEAVAIRAYLKLKDQFSETTKIMVDEQRHEKELLDILKEERVEYAGSMVLGLNDALVELTGALTGLTFALQNGKIIGITGLITGFAASLSMAASSYLSSKEEADQNLKKNPFKSAIYTGITYLLTVAVLIIPYFFISNLYLALAVMLTSSILIIFGYTFYITTAKSLKFWRRFLEMAILSLTVAAISFAMGWMIRRFLGVEL
ncbi:MAG TPA: VIT1/CCC1 transporter family protein [Candidatus Omnitrophota bacterium]|nr:VIT1/CCC1 transporter family protein [Candidatus Omnitrophota bacterium]HPD84927.1 VIT1/CCC1 transporter family protein [Candidatus Omnitrophota bacterium]HRZ03785.1 VIT1/CCC1 transporter family protein [Candidatus Omnitrophota bacterium]